MDSAVSGISSESGPLLRVKGVPANAPGRYQSLEFEFAAGSISLRCDDDTDEIIVGVDRIDSAALPVTDAWVQGLLDKRIEYTWELRNHRGYNDAFQLRLVDDQHHEEARQFEVGASTIEVRSLVVAASA